ncbi:cytochrome c [Sulfitobacter sp. F26169L]|nr:cytochrome c [Sulfitobacter sp. F26169L]MCX7568241.1 cytochrome c [Sulfitobacter sp. F26169L]
MPLGGGKSAENSVGSDAGAEIVSVTLPDALTQNAQIGQRAYDANCASCHGINAAGQEGIAPPLVHIIYEPSHHADESFQRAVSFGVRAHHWPFGDMPAVEGLTRGDVTLITAYIRELQRANGIN